MTRVWLCITILAGLCGSHRIAVADGVRAPRASALLLVAESDESHSTMNFGASAAVGGETERIVKSALENLGITVVPGQKLTPIVGEQPAGLPLGDKAAANMAQQAGARLAVSIGVIAREEGPIRATRLVGHAVQVRIRILDLAAGEPVFDKQIRLSGYGSDAGLAQKLASTRALGKLMPQVGATLSARFPAEAASGSTISIRILGAQGWREVGAILSRLASTRGVDAVHAIEIGPGQVRLRVHSGLSTASMVSTLRRARIPNGSLAATANGNDITIELTITSSSQPILNG